MKEKLAGQARKKIFSAAPAKRFILARPVWPQQATGFFVSSDSGTMSLK
jgi:hypothetical protein